MADNLKKRRIGAALWAALLLLSFLLGGCAGDGDGVTSAAQTSAEEQTGAPEPATLELFRDGKVRYKIIYPMEGSGDIVKAAERLSDAFRSCTGVRPDSGVDFLLPGREPGEYEILVGNTSRPESAAVAAELRKGEYAIRTVGQKLVICGSGATETLSAVNRFVNAYLKEKAGDVLLYSSADDYTKTNTYKIPRCLINGTPLTGFVIVSEAGSGTADYAARYLRDHLATYTGYILTVTDDDSPRAAHEIRVGNTSRGDAGAEPGTYAVRVTDADVVLCAGDYTGLYDALFAAVNELFTPANAEQIPAGKTLSGPCAAAAPQTEKAAGSLRIMYHNVWGYSYADYPILNRPQMALDVYRAYAPDVLCLEEAGNEYRGGAREVTSWLKAEGYAEICFSAEGGLGNPIFFRTGVLRLVDSGYGADRKGDKGTTWAVFERIADGKRFAVTNSHFAANSNAGGDAALGDQYRQADARTAAAQIRTIAGKYPGIPVFCGGDLNSSFGSKPCSVLSEMGAVHLRDVIADGWKMKSAYHGSFGFDTETGLFDLQTELKNDGKSSIDHIFLYAGADITAADVIAYRIVDDYSALTCSDHAPHFVDLLLP